MNKLLRFLRKIFGVHSPSKLTISIPETMSAEEALEIITIGLLGANYYIVDPVGGEQANSIITYTILKKYSNNKFNFVRETEADNEAL